MFPYCWKRPWSSVFNLHCNRLKLVSYIKLCLWLNLGFSPLTPHLWMTHNKQDHQKNIVYIFIQICRGFFLIILQACCILPSHAMNHAVSVLIPDKWFCIGGNLNAKQIERISPAINLLRAELLYLAGLLCQPLGHCWYYDFLSSCKQQVLLNGYSGLGQSWICQALAAKEVLPPEALEGFFLFFELYHPET